MNAHVSISELADMLHGRSKWKVMALLGAYFDESGMHGDARITGVGGFIGPAADWTELEEDWDALLSQVRAETGNDEIRQFHASVCNSGKAEWAGVKREARNAYLLKFVGLIEKRKLLRQINISIHTSTWDRLSTEPFKKRFVSPYQFCAEKCFSLASSASGRHYQGSPVAAVFSSHERHSKILHKILEIHIEGKLCGHVKSVSFSRPLDCTPLQTADIVSNESYKYWDRMLSGDPIAINSDRPAMIRLEELGHWEFAGCYDDFAFRTEVRRFHSMEVLPDPYPNA
jgi:Protein of unknown function (DUF3800)